MEMYSVRSSSSSGTCFINLCVYLVIENLVNFDIVGRVHLFAEIMIHAYYLLPFDHCESSIDGVEFGYLDVPVVFAGGASREGNAALDVIVLAYSPGRYSKRACKPAINLVNTHAYINE